MKLALKILGFVFAVILIFVPEVALAASDISGHWAENMIKNSIERGVISGYWDGTFKPDNPIKRSEFVALANRSMSFTALGNAGFKDVSASDWFYNDIRIASGVGYISGYPDGTFKPNDTLTRETAAVMASNMLHLAADTTYAEYFLDAGRLSWSKGAIGAAVKAGILTGYTNGEFRPENALTRAEAVTLLDKVSGKKHDGSLDIAYGYQDYYTNYVNNDASYIQTDRLAYQATNLSTTTSPASDGYYRMYNGNYGSDSVTENFNGSIQYDPTYAGTVKNIYVSGDFVVTSFVNPDTELEFQNVTIRGKLVLYGVKNVTIRNSEIYKIEFRNDTGGARVYAAEGSTIDETYIFKTGSIIDETTSEVGFRNVYMDKSCRSGVTLTTSGDFNAIYVNGVKAKLVMEKGTAETVYIVSDGENCDVEVKKNATVNFMDVRASCYVHGAGRIVLAKISADDAVFDLKPQGISGSRDPVYTSDASESGSGGVGVYVVEITVKDVDGGLLPGVSVSLYGYGEVITGSDGKARFTGVSNGTYKCVISSYNSKMYEESITVKDGDVRETFQYDDRGKYSVVITVKKTGALLEGAKVTIGSETQYTSADGKAVFSDVLAGTHDYSAEFEGETKSGSLVIVNMNISKEINFL